MKTETQIRDIRQKMKREGMEYCELAMQTTSNKYDRKMRSLEEWIRLLDWVLDEKHNYGDFTFKEEKKKPLCQMPAYCPKCGKLCANDKETEFCIKSHGEKQ